ncbi:hypothetical protein Moror_362 [Moniliophthora roreri MCA 2997]|uniref:DUF7704 domain-containing protein n=2 Tax=Moniliophthora roreri TaxID=221103 RepID=V2XZ41_MONRO|nr:hypothetical protein Moror_362 [Moniliophthora roreri MCA 2997]KAI3622692.1 hypothetical protein WG66_015067 [Moniliophthora roreri]
MSDFPALTGFYKLLFLYLEPASTMIPGLIILFYPGATWFHHQLIPSKTEPLHFGLLDDKTTMALWQLGSCYFLLGMISSFVLRAVRDAISRDVVAQEKIVGALLAALAIADLTHIASTFIGLPPELRLNVLEWNPTTHGNITATIFLFCSRMSWFMGIGRRRYHFGRNTKKAE